MFEGNLYEFTLIVADQFAGVQANKAPSPPFLSEVSNLFSKYGGQVSSQGCHGYVVVQFLLWNNLFLNWDKIV